MKNVTETKNPCSARAKGQINQTQQGGKSDLVDIAELIAQNVAKMKKEKIKVAYQNFPELHRKHITTERR